jgi:hypothetical protein
MTRILDICSVMSSPTVYLFEYQINPSTSRICVIAKEAVERLYSGFLSRVRFCVLVCSVLLLLMFTFYGYCTLSPPYSFTLLLLPLTQSMEQS